MKHRSRRGRCGGFIFESLCVLEYSVHNGLVCQNGSENQTISDENKCSYTKAVFHVLISSFSTGIYIFDSGFVFVNGNLREKMTTKWTSIPQYSVLLLGDKIALCLFS